MARTVLTENLNLYVKASGGSNGNTGLSADQAYATINYAIDRVTKDYDCAGFQITINLVADAVNKHAPFILKNYLDAGVNAQTTNARIYGNPENPALHMVEHVSGGVAALAVGVTTPWLLEGIKLSSPAGGYGIEADFYSKIYTKSIMFGNCGVCSIAVFGSSIEFLANGSYPLFTLTGACAAVLMVDMKSMIILQTAAIVFSGTPSVSYAFAMCNSQSLLYFGATTTGAINVNRRAMAGFQSLITGSSAMPTGRFANTVSPDSFVV